MVVQGKQDKVGAVVCEARETYMFACLRLGGEGLSVLFFLFFLGLFPARNRLVG